MSKTITQTVKFDGATSKDVYALFMSTKQHGAATGAPAEIGKKPGEKWKAYKGEIFGKTLHVKPNKMIVQTWRVKGWDKATPDSVLTVNLDDTKEGCELTLIHALVPDAAAPDIKKGWTKMYWAPFKKYLKANR